MIGAGLGGSAIFWLPFAGLSLRSIGLGILERDAGSGVLKALGKFAFGGEVCGGRAMGTCCCCGD